MNLHSKFFDTVEHFSFDRKMENIPTSEVILASLIRQLGLSDNQSESNVYLSNNLYTSLYHESRSDEIQKICRKELTTPVSSKIFQWKREGREAVRYREDIRAFTPQLAGHIHGVRAGGGSWNPGMWFIEEIALGFSCIEDCQDFLRQFGDALDVQLTGEREDPLAQFFNFSLRENLRQNDWETRLHKLHGAPSSKRRREIFGWKELPLHAEYVKVFQFLIGNKYNYTRYQWLQMIVSILRLFASTTTLYRLSLPGHFIDALEKGRDFASVWQHKEVVRYRNDRKQIVEDGIRKYIIDYMTICLAIQQVGIKNANQLSTEEVFKCLALGDINFKILRDEVWKIVRESHEKEFELKTSTFKNIRELLEYVGRKGEDESRLAVDFSYHFRKHGKRGGVFKLLFGDALLYVLALYAGEKEKSKSFSSEKFNEALLCLGVELKMSEYSLNGLRDRLLNLGLVEESSDSDSGLMFRLI